MNFKKGDRVKRVSNKDGGNLWHWPVGEGGVVISADIGALLFAGKADGAMIGCNYLYPSYDFELVPTARELIVNSVIRLDWAPANKDQAEAQLMRRWRAVPANCCAKCAAPLPCAYHPADKPEVDADIGF
jgi:hypothetical protein